MGELIFGVIGWALVLWFLGAFDQDSKPIKKQPPVRQQKIVTKQPELDPVKELLKKYKKFFDELLKYPLTHDQRLSIVDSRRRNLVLASAGCGKTSVLIAKLAYLHFQEDKPLSKILILAFNSSVRKELQDRLKEIGIVDAEIHTFHSFGKSVLKHYNQNSKLDKHASEDTSGVISTNFIRELIYKCSDEHPELLRKILEFRALCRHHQVYKLANSMGEFQELMQSFPYKKSRTIINDDKRFVSLPVLGGKFAVKSQQEWLIANWFILNGINVKYETAFPNVDFDYTPDFYIPEANLWIEHFAIDRDGKSPFEGYVDDANEKKNLHQSRDSNFECTYSYEYYEDIIIEKLESIMKKNDIELNPLSEKEIQKLLDDMEVDTFFRYISEMLKLIKSNIISVDEISERLSMLEDKFRANRFKEIIIPLFNTYENYLRESETIDFEDMILKAINLLNSNSNDNEFKYSHILVDEFQDLSRTRKDLLEAILNLGYGELFGVGDDWQSIYRFTGADISMTLDFDDHFKSNGPFDFLDKDEIKKEHNISDGNKVFSVAKTHRCSKNISDLASSFIIKNPYQWAKDIESHQPKNSKIKFQTMDGYTTENLITLIKKLPQPKDEESIFVLYPFNRHGKLIDLKEVNKYFPKYKIQDGSIHRAKGLEADHVILLGMDSGPWGFPMLLGEDPLRDAFLPDSDKFEYSEERRVFYVAMTRARDQLVICNNSNDRPQSRFVDEVLSLVNSKNIPYEVFEIISDKLKVIGKCPECEKNRKSGMLHIKTKNPENHNPRSRGRKYKVFIGCNKFHRNTESYDFCDYVDHQSKVPCPHCLKEQERGFLEVSFSDNAPVVRLTCNKCNQFLNYYDFHK